MKFVRFGPKGLELPGLMNDEGSIHNLSSVAPDIDGRMLGPDSLAQLARLDLSKLPIVEGNPRIGPCVGSIGKLIGVGLNYSDHAEESNLPIPTEPILFMKATSAISGPYDDVELPLGAEELDWEVELAIVIGQRAKNVTEADALDFVAGYTIVNDVSERNWQAKRQGQWVKGKSHDTFAPIGPWLVTRDEIPDVQALSMTCDVSGVRRQTGSTATMIFGVKALVSYISGFMTLEPGDVITTGTPPGVGLGMKPPQYLREGDIMKLAITGLGEQFQRVAKLH
jgi:2,4-diketo-3-deoxy-L-fuconate hydrolase